jgi:ribonuclease J
LAAAAGPSRSESDRQLRIVPLGGLGEFGLNSLVVEWGEDAILVDAGAMVPASELVGVDAIAPDFSYLRRPGLELHAVFLTHGHDDHIAALAFALRIRNAPVYGTRLTLGMARHRLRDRDASADLRPLSPGESVEAGPFRVHGIRVAHSVSDALALAIETPAGTLIHSGDFKLDGAVGSATDVAALGAWGQRGVLALLSDSTNVERRGRGGSEDDVVPAFEEVFSRASGRVAVGCFSSSFPRIQRVADVARRAGRRICFLGRRMVDNVEVASELGQLRIAPEWRITAAEAAGYPAEQVAFIVSGSQGEPGSALAALAEGEHRGISLSAGDTIVLSARVIPGCERMVSRLISAFYRRGCEVVHPGIAPVHVSGHAHQDDLAELIRLTAPRHLVPLHGEFRMLAQHARLAVQSGVPADRVGLAENGQVLGIDPAGIRRVGSAPVGRVLLDPSGTAPIGTQTVRERWALAGRGFVVPVVVVDRETRALRVPPRFVTRGVVDEASALLSDAREIVAKVLREPITAGATVEERLRTGLRRLFRRQAHRRPAVEPVVVEI